MAEFLPNALNAMLLTSSLIRALDPRAEGGSFGIIGDVYFDDRSWVVRYLAIKANNSALASNKLISSRAVMLANADQNVLRVDITRKQWEDAPVADTTLPLSREVEAQLHAHYGWIPYWSPQRKTNAWAPALSESRFTTLQTVQKQGLVDTTHNLRLRSASALRGYSVTSEAGALGMVDDIVVDVGSWSVEGLIVAVVAKHGPQKVFVPHEAIGGISDMDKRVFLEYGQEDLLTGNGGSDQLGALASRHLSLGLYNRPGELDVQTLRILSQ